MHDDNEQWLQLALQLSGVVRECCSVCLQSRMMKKPGRDNKTAVVVGTITDDARIYEIPKLKVGH